MLIAYKLCDSCPYTHHHQSNLTANKLYVHAAFHMLSGAVAQNAMSQTLVRPCVQRFVKVIQHAQCFNVSECNAEQSSGFPRGIAAR